MLHTSTSTFTRLKRHAWRSNPSYMRRTLMGLPCTDWLLFCKGIETGCRIFYLSSLIQKLVDGWGANKLIRIARNVLRLRGVTSRPRYATSQRCRIEDVAAFRR